MSQLPHTPTPWRTTKIGASIKPVSDNAATVAFVPDGFHRRGDAQFIVRACNNFDALVAALAGLVEAEQQFARESGVELDDPVSDALTAACAVLDRVREEQS
jgi:hypothetical protein